jgi:hypothetical protein
MIKSKYIQKYCNKIGVNYDFSSLKKSYGSLKAIFLNIYYFMVKIINFFIEV